MLMSQHWLEQYSRCIPGDKHDHFYALRCTEGHKRAFDIKIMKVPGNRLSSLERSVL